MTRWERRRARTRQRRWGSVSAVALTTMLMLGGAVTAFASVSTDSYLYDIPSTVHINGDEMAANEDVRVDVTYPDGSLAQSHVVQADGDGRFTDSFELLDGMPRGIYGVRALGLSSGNEFFTEFDPPNCDLTLNDAVAPPVVQYSDSRNFTGNLTAGTSGSPPCSVASKQVNLDIDRNNDGSLAGATELNVANVTSSSSQTSPWAYSIPWTVNVRPAGGVFQCTPGDNTCWRIRTFLNGSSSPTVNSGNAALKVAKEDTGTAYSGGTNGGASAALSLDADVTDGDGSSFIDDVGGDTNLTGSAKLSFTLYDSTNTNPVPGFSVTTDINATGHVTGATTTMTLPSTPGQYTMRTSYLGNDYYNTSNATTATICVYSLSLSNAGADYS